MSCREETLLLAYLNGEVEDLPAEVWAHLSQCPSCRGLLQVHMDLLEAARTPLVPGALEEEKRFLRHMSRRKVYRWVAGGILSGLAAAALLVFALVGRRPLLHPRAGVSVIPAGEQIFVFPEDGTVLNNGRLTLIVKSALPGAELLEVEVDGQALEAWMERQGNAWVLEDFYLPEEGPHDIRLSLRVGQDTVRLERIVYTGGFEL